MDKRQKTTYLSLGTNLGNRRENIDKALQLIERQVGSIIRCSSIYETEGWGEGALNVFYNAVVVVETSLSPMELLQVTQQIEKTLGRVEKTKGKYQNRRMDIDLLFYENQIIITQNLVVPHPQLPYRRFVLEPACEIDAQYIHPESGKTIKELLMDVDDKTRCTKLI